MRLEKPRREPDTTKHYHKCRLVRFHCAVRERKTHLRIEPPNQLLKTRSISRPHSSELHAHAFALVRIADRPYDPHLTLRKREEEMNRRSDGESLLRRNENAAGAEIAYARNIRRAVETPRNPNAS